MKDIWTASNAKSMDTYGKVVDQYGNPVAGVKVKMGVGLYVDFTHSGGNDYYTETDGQGKFSFVGVRGAGAGFDLKKEGYKYNLRQPSSSRPSTYTPDPDSPIIFTLWKLQGSERMTSARISSFLPLDGSAVNFDLLTGAQAASAGDVTVQYKRSALNVTGGKPFDWSITFKIENGGLVEETDAYPNEAPAEGYQPSVTIDMPATAPNWSPSVSRSFYFKGRGGQDYGRMNVTLTLGGGPQPHPVVLDALVYTNPAGSRNLEYDSNLRAQAQ